MDYQRLIDKAITFMEHNLDNEISLEDISDNVHLSLYHFHRIFTSCSGYSLKEYLRKRRLSEAARTLIFSKNKIKEIARKFQFETNEHFVRAFKKEFNLTPGEFRKKNIRFDYFPPYNETVYFNVLKKKGLLKMKPQIIEKPEFKVIGLKCTTTMADNIIPRLWDDFNKRCCEVKNGFDLWIGVCPYVEMTDMNNETPFDYIAGRAVNNFNDIPKDMVTWTVPASKYAIFTHKGSLENLNQTYKYIFCVWAKESEYEISNADQLEIYDERFKFGQEDSEFDIYIPIK
ncbi:MAG: AraC family transcriptional regulator [Candidatus Cloacimonetes bacterium]|jgi:AraC family transcriptional regulator|nr:AraC family transcriptional regulator [Candidatus Cloacimonadota bacterium]